MSKVLSQGPRVVVGTYYRIRQTIFWVVTILFLLLPWISYAGRQAILFDVAQRMFFIFDLVFWPQNIIFFALILIIAALSLFIMAAWGGRIFCGFICPQTHFISAFRGIIRRVEAVMKVKQSPDRQAAANVVSSLLITLFAIWLGFTLTGYFTPIRYIIDNILSGHIWILFWVIVLSLTIWVSSFMMRENICKFLCPYARFQGVMVDQDTLLVSYVGRPPLGAASRADCGRCKLCQVVCPAEIDIRDGSQYFCIGCAACIDACVAVSGVKGFDAPLVQFSSIAQQEKQRTLTFSDIFLRPRILGYLMLLLALMAAFFWMVISRPVIKMNVLRDRTVLARVHDTRVQNVYTCLLINQTDQPQDIRLVPGGLPSIKVDSGDQISLPPLSSKRALVTVSVRQGVVDEGMHNISLSVKSAKDHTVFLQETTTFLLEKPFL